MSERPAPDGSRLEQLVALAREPSSERRRILLREITDLFFVPAPARGGEEIELYGDVLAQLSAEMEEAVRAELAQRFAPAADAPRELVRRLAADTIAVAGPVLRQSPVLTEDDLLDVVRTQGQDHLRAVSVRETVPEAVSEVIVARGDDETLDHLVRNEGAKLSRQASEAVVDRAQRNPALHEAVVNRAALPPDLLNEMYFVVESRLRQRILEQNQQMDPALLDAALSAGRTRVAAADGALPPDYAKAEAYVRELRAAGALNPQQLARFLRSGGQTEFLIALAELAEIDFHTARHIVESRELDALAVVCKSADLDRALFLTYAVVLLNADGDAMAKAHAYARLYADLPRDAAQRTLRFWRLRRQTGEGVAA